MLENKQTKKKKPLKSNSIFLPALLIVKSIEQFPFVSNISSSFYHVLVLLLVIKRKKKSIGVSLVPSPEHTDKWKELSN